MAEPGSILSNPVASFWSHQLHYPGSLLFSLRPCGKTLANASAQIDISPIKNSCFILHVLSYRNHGNQIQRMVAP